MSTDGEQRAQSEAVQETRLVGADPRFGDVTTWPVRVIHVIGERLLTR